MPGSATTRVARPVQRIVGWYPGQARGGKKWPAETVSAVHELPAEWQEMFASLAYESEWQDKPTHDF